jgi:hypothetical protein
MLEAAELILSLRNHTIGFGGKREQFADRDRQIEVYRDLINGLIAAIAPLMALSAANSADWVTPS